MEPKNKYQFIQVGIDVSNTVRATLGPKGMNKMVLKDDVPILTNDGATIVKNLNLAHPVGKMFIGLAESQEKAIGDGTTTAVVLSGQMLENALNLLNKKMHPMTIINGYNLARNESIKFMQAQKQKATKAQVMRTTFGSKIPSQYADYFTEMLAKENIDNLRLAKVDNKPFEESGIIDGYLLDGYTLNDRMPKHVDGKIAVIDMQNNLEFAKFNITSTDELVKLEEHLRNFKKEIVDKLVDYQVKAVFLTDTNPQIENFFTEAGIMAIVVYNRRDYLDAICKATGARAIADPKADFEKYLGDADVTYEKDVRAVYILNPQSEIRTLVICGPTKQVLDEIERALDDVIHVTQHGSTVVCGGGAFEIDLAMHLRRFAESIPGKEQLAIEAFADAIETIPLILAENCGFDALEVLSILKLKHKLGETEMGVDPSRMVSNSAERGILEPVSLKMHALNAATDVANLILKLDDIYMGSDK